MSPDRWRWLGALALLFGVAVQAGETGAERVDPERRWGIGVGLRYADIPFVAPDQSTTDIVPLLYYAGERVFLNGLEGGVALLGGGTWRLNAYARYRFFDFPRGVREATRSDSWDTGLQLRHAAYRGWDMRWEFLTDGDGRTYLDLGAEVRIGGARAWLRPYAGARVKSSAFNDWYFGLGAEAHGAGVDLHARIETQVHLFGNLYLLGRIGGYRLDRGTRRSALIDDGVAWEAFAGVGLFNPPDKARRAALGSNAYWRAAHGWATPSSLGSILRWETEADPYHNQLTSLFYGHPVADDLFGWSLDIYVTLGLVYHHASAVQSASIEYVIAIKAYYTWRWPVRVRLGAAERLSYASQVTHVERTKLEAQGYRPSKLLNYLDFSVDVNVGDLFGAASARRLWIGYGIHHRSGIFETGSQFGHVSGGSNYNTLYLQWHF